MAACFFSPISGNQYKNNCCPCARYHALFHSPGGRLVAQPARAQCGGRAPSCRRRRGALVAAGGVSGAHCRLASSAAAQLPGGGSEARCRVNSAAARPTLRLREHSLDYSDNRKPANFLLPSSYQKEEGNRLSKFVILKPVKCESRLA